MSSFSNLDNLSEVEKDAVAQVLLFQRLQTKEQLKLWLQFFLGVDLADCVVSRFANSSPLDMVWDIYQFCADEKNEEPADYRYIAGRASQKTLSLAALKVLLALHFRRPVVHFGGTLPQAKRAYTYFKKFVMRPYVKSYLKSEPTQQKTTFTVGGEEVDIEILSISTMAVQGAHAPIVSLDELASLAPDKVKAYEDVSGIPVYTQDGKPWIKFGISSRKGAYTVIEREYEDRDKSGIMFKFWSVLENTKRCPDSVSGTEDYTYYVNALENSAITVNEYSQVSEADKTKFERVEAKRGCFTCPLKAICAGDLKKQTSNCSTLRPAKSVIQEFKTADLQWFLSQKMSMTPSLEGLVFQRFKKQVFEKTVDEMYEIFTGTPPASSCSEDELINLMLSKGCKAYAGLDHGHTDPAVLVTIYEDSVGNIYIMNVYAQVSLDPEQLRDKIFELHDKYKFVQVYADPSGGAINDLIRKAKRVKIIDDFNKKGEIANGIMLIRQKISPTVGGTKLFGLKGNCDFFIKEMEKYHNEEDAAGNILDTPADEWNHCFTEGHEILTDSGWKYFKDLSYEDSVAEVKADRSVSFTVPMKIIKSQYKGEVLRFKNQRVDFCVTPEHRIVKINQYDRKVTKTNKLSTVKAKDVYSKHELNIPLSGNFEFKDSYVQPFPEWGLDDQEWGWLLGMFLAEGCSNVHKTTNQHRTHWDQKKEPHLTKLRTILEKIKNVQSWSMWTSKQTGTTTFEISNKRVHEYFSQFGKSSEKYIPRDVLSNGSKELLSGMFLVMMLGDGSIMGSNFDYTTISKRLADDFMELAVRLGYDAHIKGPYKRKEAHHRDSYKIRMSYKKEYPSANLLIKKHVHKEEYEGLVHCVSVPSGMIMCRYNGKVFISGNSIDAARYAAINRWNRGSRVLGTTEEVKQDETKAQYVSKVEKQNADWLVDKIREASAGAEVDTVQTSKNKLNKWSF